MTKFIFSLHIRTDYVKVSRSYPLKANVRFTKVGLMKILLLHTNDYWLKPFQRNLATASLQSEPIQCKNAIVALIHTEEKDEQNPGGVATRALKNIKWHARKIGTDKIVLHSFAHLSKSKSSPECAQEIQGNIQSRLQNSGYQVFTSPFGYFNEFKLQVAGPSLAKVFVEI